MVSWFLAVESGLPWKDLVSSVSKVNIIYRIALSILESNDGHHSHVLACAFIFDIPKCAECNSFSSWSFNYYSITP
jgi:hypothetical protein